MASLQETPDFHSVREKSDLERYYRDRNRATHYVEERFKQPLGALLHRRQVTVLKDVIWRHCPDSVLEIAGGPARITADLADMVPREGIMLDASEPMLEIARERLNAVGGGRWHTVLGDAFDLPFQRTFDLVYSFRFIRHFQTQPRLQLYGQVRRVLAPDGIFVFDAVNELVSAPLRAAQPSAFPVYDVLYRLDTLRAELAESGFELIEAHGVWRRFRILQRISVVLGPPAPGLAYKAIDLIDRFSNTQPMEWIVVCRRG